jgi:hypothetical protein
MLWTNALAYCRSVGEDSLLTFGSGEADIEEQRLRQEYDGGELHLQRHPQG